MMKMDGCKPHIALQPTASEPMTEDYLLEEFYEAGIYPPGEREWAEKRRELERLWRIIQAGEKLKFLK